MEGIDKENPKLIFWGDLIKESGIETDHIEKLLELCTTSADPHFFLGQFVDYLDKLDPVFFEYDAAQKKFESLGIKNEITLTETQQTLYNLFHQLRSDQNEEESY